MGPKPLRQRKHHPQGRDGGKEEDGPAAAASKARRRVRVHARGDGEREREDERGAPGAVGGGGERDGYVEGGEKPASAGTRAA